VAGAAAHAPGYAAVVSETVIGVDVGGTKILAGRLAVDGTVEAERSVATDTSGAGALLAQIAQLVHALRADGTCGVGVGFPATVDQVSGSLVTAVNLPLHEVAVRDRLATAVALPVELDNDGNCAALAEHVHGAAKGTRHSVTLTLGTGVGGGAVNEGALLRGYRGAGLELGHIVVDRNGPPCQGACRGHGHLETYCSGRAVATAGVAAGVGDAHVVVARARAGDAVALAVVEDAARALGVGLVTLANVFGPEVIVLGGGFGEAAAELLIPAATQVLREQALPPMASARVVAARLGNEAGMIGAGELVRQGGARPTHAS